MNCNFVPVMYRGPANQSTLKISFIYLCTSLLENIPTRGISKLLMIPKKELIYIQELGIWSNSILQLY